MEDSTYYWNRAEAKFLKNRTFDTTFISNELEQHKSILPMEPFYRARLISKTNAHELNKSPYTDEFFGFPALKSGAPKPKDIRKVGRCNKKHESVLYIASDKYTALAEVRPGKRQRVSIAEFRLKRQVTVIDIFYTESGHPSLYSLIALNFYLPCNDDQSIYKVSRNITSIIRKAGCDGIRFSSSLSESGSNIVLFDPQNAECINSKIYQTHSMLYYAEEQKPRKADEKLLPKSITDRFSDDQTNWFLDQFKN